MVFDIHWLFDDDAKPNLDMLDMFQFMQFTCFAVIPFELVYQSFEFSRVFMFKHSDNSTFEGCE